jgi:RNA-directed DNA polymerase
MDRVRRRIGDKRVLALVRAFRKAGILTQDGAMRDTVTGSPQGGGATRKVHVVSGSRRWRFG